MAKYVFICSESIKRRNELLVEWLVLQKLYLSKEMVRYESVPMYLVIDILPVITVRGESKQQYILVINLMFYFFKWNSMEGFKVKFSLPSYTQFFFLVISMASSLCKFFDFFWAYVPKWRI